MSVTINTTVHTWLQELKIPASKTYIKQQLFSHPDYPSLLSITDTLNELGIENTAVHIEKGQLHEVPTPFLAHLNDRGGEFAVIRKNEQPDQQVAQCSSLFQIIQRCDSKPGWRLAITLESPLNTKQSRQ